MSQDRSLTRVRVEGLFGRFNHRVDFPAGDTFVIVHGPNGVGKTRLLDLVSALAWPVNFTELTRTPFRSLELQFSDNSVLTVEKTETQEPNGLRFHLRGEKVETETWSPRESDATSDALRRTLLRSPSRFESLSRRERDLRNLLLHRSDVDVWSVLSELNPEIQRDLHEFMGEPAPQSLREFLSDFKVHFIDTHRLRGLQSSEEQPGRARTAASPTKVEEFSKELRGRLAKALEDNSRTSQDLDRTYPRRLLEEPADVSEQEIRDRYVEQEEWRRRLGEVSLVDEQTEVIDIPEEMEPWQRAVLWTYLRDTEDKLSTFNDILDRVSLLRDVVNSRFLFKTLEIDGNQGFKITNDDDGEELDLTSLSSGEQHELVLTYDLLFNTEPGALVLIDEPEISLHVSWQKAFMRDLQKIAELVKFRTIIATHSPQIAGKWADRMVVLGPDTE
ncbi:AAA family ATPase (plasmid) [Streptomyces sp. NBC_01426]|uniref:AAA family ATPase n=1 Tax=Streptomyces sp. NBC_01426 TaxID=2975866 RepID=UPI002E32A45E|nr:AAA family ATPase [Streptomyces sp. NBC_01426]